VVHTDLKPESVVLTPGGSPVLEDFRPADLAGDAGGEHRGSPIAGTHSPMVPELLTLRHAAARPPAVDVYRVGAVLYEMLAGQPPCRGHTPLETLHQVLTQPPLPLRQLRPGVPCDLEAVCMRCLEKQPAGRYQCLGDLANDLACHLQETPALADPAGPVPRPAGGWWNWLRQVAGRKGTPGG
jgi:serine/threonine-protein kinase